MEKIYLVQKLDMDVHVCAMKKITSALHNLEKIKEAHHLPAYVDVCL